MIKITTILNTTSSTTTIIIVIFYNTITLTITLISRLSKNPFKFIIIMMMINVIQVDKNN